jgi:outer membrane protein
VYGAREALRVIEQTVLLNVATAYMDVLRDSDIRFNYGEVTTTDVAQAEAQLAVGLSRPITSRIYTDGVKSKLSTTCWG